MGAALRGDRRGVRRRPHAERAGQRVRRASAQRPPHAARGRAGAAADRLVAADDAQEGLWFARAALRRDRTREDAYTALMRAQIAAGQRTAALETYFECRRFLTTELGIDPSLATMELYRSIIETEELLE